MAVVDSVAIRSESTGFTLVEALTALVCVFIALHLVMQTQLRLAVSVERERQRASQLTAVRAARVVLRAETATSARAEDWSPPTGDSLLLRALRGTGYRCGPRVEDGFSYDGVRAPVAMRDSVLVLTEAGTWSVAHLTASPSGAACGTWTLEPPHPDAVVVIPFERGSYHLGSGALRYRAGRGGRQPLTETVLEEYSLVGRHGQVGVVR